MASVFYRGPRSAPRWFARYLDTSGVWRAKRVRVESRTDAMKIARQLEATAERRRYGLEAPEGAGLLMRELLEKFRLSLTNRSWRDDQGRLRLHVTPRWGGLRVDQVTLPAIMSWLDEMRAEAKIAPGTQRHALGLLSRAFSWAVARGLAPSNPCRLIPPGARPQATPAREATAWIADDETPLRLMELLPEPFNLAFYVAFTSGCRMGEAFGLHIEDLDELAAGCIRIARSFGGPLKEDKKGVGLTKFVPAAADALEVLGPWLDQRRADGAGPEDLVFPGVDGKVMPRYLVAYQWRKAAKVLGLTVSWHKATRTSAASRWAARGVDIGQIAAALGHHGTEIAIRHYQKWVRKTFDPRMTRALTAPGRGGNVIAMPVATGAPAAPSDVNDDRPSRTEDKDAA
jgi:integrase